MARKSKVGILLVCLSLSLLAVFVTVGAAADAPASAQTIERLERLILEQQNQLKSLQEQVNELKKTTADAQTQAQKAESVATEAKTMAQPPSGMAVTSGGKQVKLAISGQVHRAMNVADDGKSTHAYFVDPDSSNTRVRFIGTAAVDEDLTIGTKIEVAIAPNESSQVSQQDEESGDFFDQRWAEISLASRRFGKLSFGKGDTASNNSAEVDLSKTDVVQYASVADIAGGMLFRQNSGDSLTSVRVSDAFKDLDGLSRKSRVRYDTPTFHGFHLSGSWVSDQRYDLSLWWGGQGRGFKAAGALALADPNEDGGDLQYDGSFSVLHEATGLNFTLSAGVKDRDNQGDPSNVWSKIGWLTRFSALGETAFALDYGESANLPTKSDDGYSWGIAVVQQVEEYGTEVYAQYRLFSLDRDGAPSVQDISVGTLGARVKF